MLHKMVVENGRLTPALADKFHMEHPEAVHTQHSIGAIVFLQVNMHERSHWLLTFTYLTQLSDDSSMLQQWKTDTLTVSAVDSQILLIYYKLSIKEKMI